ncbi:hypothetical protein QBC37DRAFT_390293 [Rhypophila decipiens]|uniref:Uncharacterized protein n=1 Tax=Rhypophila decipiens TaxID=261697 RepID=A0AAN7B564_9PEZI|nr:hypothetical protein QBC37DRAFT_390293 [Rhypophila decipiens]
MDHTSIPKIQEAAGANNNYSTLEVAIGAPDYDKEVVDPQHYPYVAQDSQPYFQQQIPGLQDGAAWGTGAEPGPDTTASTVDDQRRILGLKRRTFFILAWAVSLLLAIGIGVGAGLGATIKSRNGGDSQAAGAATTSETDLAAITGPPTTTSHSRTPALTASPSPTSTNNNNNSPPNRPPPSRESESPKAISTTTPIAPPPTTTNPPKPPTTTTSTPSNPTTSTKPPKVGGAGGRCQNEWGSDCICLDDGICVNKWKGTPYTGYEGNWPCPDDPDNVMACVVKPCLGQEVTGQTQCLWREACSKLAEVGGAGTGAAICPGDGGFICCAHPW